MITPADKKRVFIALRPIFRTKCSTQWTVPLVRSRLEQYGREDAPLRKHLGEATFRRIEHVKEELGEPKFFKTAKRLLLSGIFYNAAKRAQHLPDLESTEEEIPEASDPLNAEKEMEFCEDPHTDPDPNTAKPAAPVPATGEQVLNPSYFSYRVQHLLLVEVQRLLEESYFEFFERRMPELLSEKKWDCPEAAEINDYTKALLGHYTKFFGDAPTSALRRAKLRVDSATQLRNIVVHRSKTRAEDIQTLVVEAARIVQILQDTKRAERLSDLAAEVAIRIDSMRRAEETLQNDLDTNLERIRRQQEALEKQKAEFKEKAKSKDLQSKKTISEALRRSILPMSRGHYDGTRRINDGERLLWKEILFRQAKPTKKGSDAQQSPKAPQREGVVEKVNVDADLEPEDRELASQPTKILRPAVEVSETNGKVKETGTEVNPEAKMDDPDKESGEEPDEEVEKELEDGLDDEVSRETKEEIEVVDDVRGETKEEVQYSIAELNKTLSALEGDNWAFSSMIIPGSGADAEQEPEAQNDELEHIQPETKSLVARAEFPIIPILPRLEPEPLQLQHLGLSGASLRLVYAHGVGRGDHFIDHSTQEQEQAATPQPEGEASLTERPNVSVQEANEDEQQGSTSTLAGPLSDLAELLSGLRNRARR